MARVESLLLVLCTAGSAAGSLLPGGHHHSATNHNSVDLSGGVFTKPGEPLQPFATQRPPAAPPGRLPQLYVPPQTSGGSEIAIEPADEFTPLSSGPPLGLEGSSVPDFVEPDFGGWIPMTSSPDHQSQSTSQAGGESLSSPPSSISQQPTGSGFVQGSFLSEQQSQLQSQTGSGDNGFAFTSGSSSSSMQEELLTNAWSQGATAQSGGGHGGLPASYVPPSPGSGGSFSQGGSVPADLKPLSLPQPSGPSSSPPSQSFGENIGTSFAPSYEAGNSFSEVQAIPTNLKPLDLPQPESIPSQFLSSNEGSNTGSSFSNVHSSSGGGASFSQAGVTVGESSQVPSLPGSGDINLPSSYVPPTSQEGGSFSQGNQVPVDLKPLGLPEAGGFSSSLSSPPFGENTAISSSTFGSSSSGGGISSSQGQQPVPTILKPLGLPQTEPVQTFLKPLDLPQPGEQQPVQTFLKPLDLPQTEPVQTFLKPLDLPQPGEQQPVQTFLKPLDLPQTQPVQTFLKPLDLPQPGEQQPVQTFLKPLDLPQTEPVQTFLKPLDLPQHGEQQPVQTFLKPLDLPQTEPVQTFLKPLDLPQPGEQQPVQTFLKPLDLPQTEPVQTFLKPLDLPQPGEQQPVQTFLKPLDLPQTEPVQTFLKPLDLPQPGEQQPVQIFLKPLDLPQTQPVQTFLKPLDLPQPGEQQPVQTFLKPLDLPQTEPVQTFLKPLDLPQPGEQQPVQTSLKPLDLPQTEPVQTFLKPLNLPQPEEQPVETSLKPLNLPQIGGPSVPTILKPLNLPQTGPQSQQAFQTNSKPLAPSYVPPPSEGGDSFSQGGPFPAELKPLGLPQAAGLSTQPLSQTFSQNTVEGEPSVPTILKPLGLPETEQSPSSQSQTGDVDFGALSSSYQPPSLSGNSFSQSGSVPTELKPLGLPRPEEVASQSSFQTGSQNTGHSPSSSNLPSSGGENTLSQGETSVPVLVKPTDLPPQTGLSSSQFASQPSGGEIGGPSSFFSSPSAGGDDPFSQGSVTAGGASSITSQQGSSGNYAPSSPSYVAPSSEGGNFLTEGAGTSPGIVPTLLKPLGLPPTEGSSSGSSAQLSAGGSSSSYSPSTQGAGTPQVVTSSGESSSHFTSQQAGGGTAPSIASYQPTSSSGGFSAPEPVGVSAPPLAGSLTASGVPTLLKPLGLPSQVAVEPEQNFVQPAFPSVVTIDVNQPGSPSASEYVDNKPLFPAGTPVDEPFSPQGGVPQGGSIAGSQNSQPFPGSEGTAPLVGFSGLSVASASSVTGGVVALSSQTSEPTYQPEIALGAAASGGVGSSVPFPRPPVQNKPLGLSETSLGSGLSSSGVSAGSGSPPSLVIDEQFLTGPSGGPSVVSPPGTPVGATGGGGFSGGSGGSAITISGGAGGSAITISGGGGVGINSSGGGGISSSGGLDSGSASISSISSSGGGSGGPVEILSQNFKIDENGNYEYSYEQSDGQAAQETGQFTAGNEPETGSLASTGGYRYRGTDGRQYAVEYTADERGFIPTGDHLPTPPAQIAAYAELRERYPGLFWAEKLRVRNPVE